MSGLGGGSSPRLRPRRLAPPHRWWRPDDVPAHGTTHPLPDVHERRGKRIKTDDSRRRHYQQRCRSMPLIRYASDGRTLYRNDDRTCGPSHAWSYPHRLTQHLSVRLPEDWKDTPLALPQVIVRRSDEPNSVVRNSCMPPELLSLLNCRLTTSRSVASRADHCVHSAVAPRLQLMIWTPPGYSGRICRISDSPSVEQG